LKRWRQTVSLTATDLDLSLPHLLQRKVKKEGACTIPARKTVRLRKAAADADITIKLLENHWLASAVVAPIPKWSVWPSQFPGLPVFPSAGAIKIPAAVLRSMIAKTGFAIASEESRTHSTAR